MNYKRVMDCIVGVLILQTSQRDNLHPVGPRIGHLAASQHNHQVRLTYRHLLLVFIMLMNQPLQLQQMTRTVLNLVASQFS